MENKEDRIQQKISHENEIKLFGTERGGKNDDGK